MNGPDRETAVGLGHIEVAEADEPNQSLLFELDKGRHCFLIGRAAVGPVNLIDVDVVGAEPPQTLSDLMPNARSARIPPDLGLQRVPLKPHFRGDDEPIALPRFLNRLPDQCLCAAMPVDRGGVDQRNFQLDCPPDRG